jgi:hypothetical protein
VFLPFGLLADLAAPAGAQQAGPERQRGQARAEAPASADPFARRAWHVELGGQVALEAWNYNISRETMFGLVQGVSYGIRDGLAIRITWPLYRVEQPGVDPHVLGITFGVRGRVYRRSRVTAFLELDVGVSYSELYVPPRGTRFNYLALGAVGATVRLHPGVHVLGEMRWLHLSNNNLAGRHRNPDIEALGPQLGLLIAF